MPGARPRPLRWQSPRRASARSWPVSPPPPASGRPGCWPGTGGPPPGGGEVRRGRSRSRTWLPCSPPATGRGVAGAASSPTRSPLETGADDDRAARPGARSSRRGRARRGPAPWAEGRPGPPCHPGSWSACLSAYPWPPGRLGRRQRPRSNGRRVPAGRAGGYRAPPRSRVAHSPRRAATTAGGVRCRSPHLILTRPWRAPRGGRARRPVEPHEDRPSRVMIAIHVDPEVRDQLRAIAYEQKVPLRGLGLRRAQRRFRPAPQTRNRPLILIPGSRATDTLVRPAREPAVDRPPRALSRGPYVKRVPRLDVNGQDLSREVFKCVIHATREGLRRRLLGSDTFVEVPRDLKHCTLRFGQHPTIKRPRDARALARKGLGGCQILLSTLVVQRP